MISSKSSTHMGEKSSKSLLTNSSSSSIIASKSNSKAKTDIMTESLEQESLSKPAIVPPIKTGAAASVQINLDQSGVKSSKQYKNKPVSVVSTGQSRNAKLASNITEQKSSINQKEASNEASNQKSSLLSKLKHQAIKPKLGLDKLVVKKAELSKSGDKSVPAAKKSPGSLHKHSKPKDKSKSPDTKPKKKLDLLTYKKSRKAAKEVTTTPTPQPSTSQDKPKKIISAAK